MHIAISAPSGYNAREILLPLRPLLEVDDSITSVVVFTPAANWRTRLFPHFSSKFDWHSNPKTQSDHNTLLAKLKPDVLLTPTIGLDPKDIPILRAAKKNHIPTLTFVASWDNVFKMERLKEHGHSGATKKHAGDYELPDHFAVWNQTNKDHILKIFPGFSSDNITITGPPRFDYFAHEPDIPSKEQLLNYLELPTDDLSAPLIHFATTELYPFEYIIRQIYLGIQKNKLTSRPLLYASVHPGGDIANHSSYAQYNVRVRYSFGRLDNPPHPDFAYLPTTREMLFLVSLFKHSGLLINQSSTVAIESMRCDVPVINVKYGQQFDWLRWYRSMVYRDFKQHYRYITDHNAAIQVNSRRSLIPTVNQYLSQPNLHQNQRLQTTKKLITYTDGSSSKRLIQCAKRLLNNPLP